MDPDLFLVIGVVILGFAIPSIISAFSAGRAPRAAAIMIMIGGSLVALAAFQQPGGYEIGDIPDAFSSVIGRYIR